MIKYRSRIKIIGALRRYACCFVMMASLLFTAFTVSNKLHMVRVSDVLGNTNSFLSWKKNDSDLFAMSGIIPGESQRYYKTVYADDTICLKVSQASQIAVTADSLEQKAESYGETVEEILQKSGVILGEHDYTEPSLHCRVKNGDRIAVHRVHFQDTITQKEIPYETEYVYTSLFYRRPGTTMTLQNGKNGIKEITNRERVVDGKVESAHVVKTEVTLEPKSLIIKAYGPGAPVSSLEGPELVNGIPATYRAVYTGRATGYYSARGRGSSGLGLHYGTVAVNPALIPYGTKMYICSTDGRFVYGYAIATDTGTAMMQGVALVDLFYETYEESVMNGAKQVNVYIVG